MYIHAHTHVPTHTSSCSQYHARSSVVSGDVLHEIFTTDAPTRTTQLYRHHHSDVLTQYSLVGPAWSRTEECLGKQWSGGAQRPLLQLLIPISTTQNIFNRNTMNTIKYNGMDSGSSTLKWKYLIWRTIEGVKI